MQLIPAYFPPIYYIAQLIKQPVTFCVHAHYQKQTYRNRCTIYGANGKLNLSIPIQHLKTGQHQKDREVDILSETNWKKNHWRSLAAAYRSSPFFEFYEDELSAVFFQNESKLYQYNLNLIECIAEWLSVDIEYTLSNAYTPLTHEEEQLIKAKGTPEIKLPSYAQVFDNKYGFITNLSILDLIFHLGPASTSYLEKIG